MILNISQSCGWKFLIIDTSMDSGYKKPAGTSGTDLEYWASRLLADTTDYTWWNLYTKDYTDKTITAFGFRDIGRGWSNAGQPEARIYGRQERGGHHRMRQPPLLLSTLLHPTQTSPSRSLAGNPDSAQAVVFLTSIIDEIVGVAMYYMHYHAV